MGAARFAGRTWLLVSGVVVLLGYDLAGYLLFGFRLVDAVYLTLSALTTEGFATPVTLSDGAKIFAVSLSLFDVTVFVAVLGVLASVLVDGQLVHKSRRWSMQRWSSLTSRSDSGRRQCGSRRRQSCIRDGARR
jgi:ion channel